MKKHKLKIKKISIRISLYFSSLILLIAIVISILNIRIYSQELSSQIDNVVVQKLSLMSGKVNNNLEEIKSIHTSMINDSSIKNAFQNTYDEETDSNIQILTTLINRHPSIGSDNKTVIALGLNGEIYNPIADFPSYQGLTNNNDDFDKMKNKTQYFRFSKPNTFPNEHLDPTEIQKNNITLFAQYFNYESMTQIGYIAINFRKNLLFDDIELIASETFDTVYILNENNELIHQIGDLPYQDISPSLTKSNKESYSLDDAYITYEDKTYSILSTSLPSYERWKIITLFDRGIIQVETKRLNQSIYIVLAIALVLMLLTSWIISQKITDPIREVVTSMKVFEKGQWPEPLVSHSEDEIKDLVHGYNGMLKSFIKLTDDMIGRHQENKMIEIDLIKTQIGLLEAQINPHFIHNTLNSMNYLALKEGNTELSMLIESFNKLLRMSMATDVSFVTVSQEINNINDYSRIQNVRFENAFDLVCHVDPDASIGKIPKLILQPLVENSIIHGILPTSLKGEITISIDKIDSSIVVSVQDNGQGMDDSTLQTLLNNDSSQFSSKHIGVQNVFDRIKLYYGEDITYTITSKHDNGTRVSFSIPYED